MAIATPSPAPSPADAARFNPQHVEPKWPRDRGANIKHIKLEVALDFDAKKISGTATHRISAIAGPLDASNSTPPSSTITAVRAGESRPRSRPRTASCEITLPRALAAGDEIEIAIDYSATSRGADLYFVGPDDGYPNKPRQAWTQGEDEDSRYWFPCYDYPNNRTHQRGNRDRAGKIHRGLQRRADRASPRQCGREDPHLSLAP